jgi:hypothetical protein
MEGIKLLRSGLRCPYNVILEDIVRYVLDYADSGKSKVHPIIGHECPEGE